MMISKLLFVSLSILTVVLFGCATGHQHQDKALVDGSRIDIIHSKDKQFELKEVRVSQDGSDLVVFGKVKKKGSIYTSYNGHIDIALVQPDKEIVLETAEYKHFPSEQVLSAFDVHFPGAISREARILIYLHPVDGNGMEHSKAVEMLISKSR